MSSPAHRKSFSGKMGGPRHDRKQLQFPQRAASLFTGTLAATIAILSITSAAGREDSLIIPPVSPKTSIVDTTPPVLAYLIIGSRSDATSLPRLLLSLYHPHNEYLLYLESNCRRIDVRAIRRLLKSHDVFEEQKNVQILRGGRGISRGVTMLSIRLHGAAILLKQQKKWDWMMILSASDYPLYTQDDILSAMATIPKELSFISRFKENVANFTQRFDRIYLDPFLLDKNGRLIETNISRRHPLGFELTYGSSTVILSREFVEYCTMGYDDFTISLLLYLANAASASESYFQTVACNSPFRNLSVDLDLRYVAERGIQDIRMLNESYYGEMVHSNLMFAGKFPKIAPVLELIDRELLNKEPHKILRGGWCKIEGIAAGDSCLRVGNVTRMILSLRFPMLVDLLQSNVRPNVNQMCQFHQQYA